MRYALSRPWLVEILDPPLAPPHSSCLYTEAAEEALGTEWATVLGYKIVNPKDYGPIALIHAVLFHIPTETFYDLTACLFNQRAGWFLPFSGLFYAAWQEWHQNASIGRRHDLELPHGSVVPGAVPAFNAHFTPVPPAIQGSAKKKRNKKKKKKNRNRKKTPGFASFPVVRKNAWPVYAFSSSHKKQLTEALQDRQRLAHLEKMKRAWSQVQCFVSFFFHFLFVEGSLRVFVCFFFWGE